MCKYDIIGNTLDIAEKVQEKCIPSEVFISETTYNIIKSKKTLSYEELEVDDEFFIEDDDDDSSSVGDNELNSKNIYSTLYNSTKFRKVKPIDNLIGMVHVKRLNDNINPFISLNG